LRAELSADPAVLQDLQEEEEALSVWMVVEEGLSEVEVGAVWDP